MTIPTSLAQRLRDARLKAGITIAGLARACGLDKETIRRIESGEVTMVRAETAAAICKALGVSVEDVFVDCITARGRAPHIPSQRRPHPLRTAREDAGLTVAELASSSGVSRRTITSIENGKIPVSRDVVTALVSVLQYNPDILYKPNEITNQSTRRKN